VGRLPLELQASYTSLPEELEQASRSTGGERRAASGEWPRPSLIVLLKVF
jgi:hypothetical protein